MPTASVIKPGIHLSALEKDCSTFGGLVEIHGFTKDLQHLGIEVVLNAIDPMAEYLFIFPSACHSQAELELIRHSSAIKIQCVTDLNLFYSAAQIGDFIALNQMPGSPGYFPFERYVLRKNQMSSSDCYERWCARPISALYAGGSRNGERAHYIAKYVNSKVLDRAIGSFDLPDGRTPEKKLPFEVLQDVYRSTKFALLISDPLYVSFGMVTQRAYEYLSNGVVPVIDESCAYMLGNDFRFALVNDAVSADDFMEQFDSEDYERYIFACNSLFADQNDSQSLLKATLTKILEF